MSVRLKLFLGIPLCVALISLGTHFLGSSHADQRGNAGPAVETRGADWTVQVGPPWAFGIAHKGVPIVSTEVISWGKNWSWAGTEFKGAPGGDGRNKFSGNIDDLHVKLVGEVESPAPNVIRMDLLIRAEKASPEVIGSCWQWNLKLDSPSFGGKLPDPQLLPDGQGWSWSVGGGRAITLRFEGAAKVEFERGNKNTIRTFVVADRIEPGTRRLRMTLELPEGGRRVPTLGERYDRADPKSWFPGALAPDSAPLDLRFLNRDDRPAGRRGFVRADGDRLVFADGSPARFWGGNLAAYSLFATPREEVANQARRMARLGYNLMRIHHHDSDWVAPNVFGSNAKSTRHLDPRSLESIDWWIKCLKDEGIYVWLDIQVGRTIKPGDGLTQGADEVARREGKLTEFCYYNGQLRELMKEFQREYLNHSNRHTNLRYRDDPAVIGVLITNENDATSHGCFAILPDKHNPFHNAIWTKGYRAFAARFGLSADHVSQTWLPGPSKLYLAQVEHDFNVAMIADLRGIGVRAPIATTSLWGEDPLYSLPPLTDGDLIDTHSYGQGEELTKNAHFQGNFLTWIAMGQAYGKPLSVTEWNVEYPNADRFTAPLFTASIASLQGWDAPMIFAYSQGNFSPNPGPEKWSTYNDPSLTAVMPAAALLYRRGHVSPASKTYCFIPDPNALFNRSLTPNTSATIRTLAEQSRLTIGMPAVPELPWLKPTKPSDDAIVVTDPDRDFIPEAQSFVRSDTGELTRDWELGIQTIDTTRTQAVGGWIGGRTLKTRDASFEIQTKKAVVALTSVDDRPLSESRFILLTAVARSVPSPGDRPPFLSEPVRGRITMQSRVADLELLALDRDGQVAAKPAFERHGDSFAVELPAAGGTLWYLLKAPTRPADGKSLGAAGDRPSAKNR
jgi:hypothetical protein